MRHHLLDIISPDEDFSAGMFKELAEEVINDLNKRSKRTVLVGGTYLYIKVLLSGLIDVLPRKPEVRDRLKQRKYIEGTTKLHDELKTVDPAAASRIDPNDYVRIERALEVHYMTGDKISELHSRHDFKEKHYDYMKIGISMERENLYKVIDNRVETMIRDGFVEEVVRLRKMGYDRSLKPMQSIGYKEINAHIDGETGLEEALGLIKRNSRRLAKRQMTWLRRDSEIKWFSMPDDFKRIVQISEQHYQDT